MKPWIIVTMSDLNFHVALNIMTLYCYSSLFWRKMDTGTEVRCLASDVTSLGVRCLASDIWLLPAGCWLCTSVSGYWSSARWGWLGGGVTTNVLVFPPPHAWPSCTSIHRYTCSIYIQNIFVQVVVVMYGHVILWMTCRMCDLLPVMYIDEAGVCLWNAQTLFLFFPGSWTSTWLVSIYAIVMNLLSVLLLLYKAEFIAGLVSLLREK